MHRRKPHILAGMPMVSVAYSAQFRRVAPDGIECPWRTEVAANPLLIVAVQTRALTA